MINNSVDRNGTKITGKSTGTGLDITVKLCFIMFECCWLVVCRPEYFNNTSFPFFFKMYPPHIHLNLLLQCTQTSEGYVSSLLLPLWQVQHITVLRLKIPQNYIFNYGDRVTPTHSFHVKHFDLTKIQGALKYLAEEEKNWTVDLESVSGHYSHFIVLLL